MYTTCAACGATIKADVELCPYCGKPVPPPPQPKAEGSNWDYCGILAVRTLKKHLPSGKVEYECCFRAEAMGRNGPYTIAATDQYSLIQKWTIEDPDPMGQNEVDHRVATEKLNGLIQILQKDGWEMLPQTGPRAWDYKFKRKTSVA